MRYKEVGMYPVVDLGVGISGTCPPFLVWPLIKITVVHDSLQVSCRLANHQVGAVSLKRVWLAKPE